MILCVALACHGCGETNEKIRELKKRVSVSPKDPVPLVELGDLYQEENRYEQAVKCFYKAISADPEYAPSYFSLGRSYYLNRKSSLGKEAFNKFQQVMDKNVQKVEKEALEYYLESLYYIGYLYMTNKDYDPALGIYKKITGMYPEDQKALYNMAYLYYKHYRKNELAYRNIQEVIRIGTDRRLNEKARFFLDYMRNNPDPRYREDLDFIDK